MELRRNIYFKRTIIYIFIGFSILFSLAVIYVFNSGKKMDKKHINVFSLSNEVDNRTLETRILIDNYLLDKNTETINQIKKNTDSIVVDLEKLKVIFTEEFKRIKNNDLEDFLDEYKIISKKLLLFNDHIKKNKPSHEKLLELYTDFNTNYRQFGQYLNRYLYDNTILYEKEIWGLIFILFLLIILSGYLIIRLINKLIKTDRNLIKNTIEIEVKERKRIAADLHDELGAYLSGLIMYIEVLEQECDNHPQIKSKIIQAGKLSRQAIKSVEIIVNNLNPSYLSSTGLIKTLTKAIEKVNALNKTQFKINTTNFELELPSDVEITLFRVCTELINNALKHSQAKNAVFTIKNQNKKIYLKYKDDGIGFKPDDSEFVNKKSGLYNLNMRINSLGGSFIINSAPDSGVKIVILLTVN